MAGRGTLESVEYKGLEGDVDTLESLKDRGWQEK